MNKIVALSRTAIFFVLLAAMVFSSVSITSSDPYSSCGLGSCEPISISIAKTGAPLSEQVYLTIDYANDNGEIIWAKNFLKKGKRTFELNAPFNLPNGNHDYEIQFYGIGSGKFNVSVIGANTGTTYAVLDPWWNSTFTYRTNLNLTSSSNTLNDFQVLIVLNDSNINYSNTNDDGSDLRFTWYNATSGTEQEIPFWIQEDAGWNESGNTYVWIKAPLIDTDGEQYYYYYGNKTAITSATNGEEVFEFFDDFDDCNINVNLWDTSEAGGLILNESNGLLIIQGSNSADGGIKAQVNYTYGEEYSLIAKVKQDFGKGLYWGWNKQTQDLTTGYNANDLFLSMSNANDFFKIRVQNDGTSTTSGTYTMTDNIYYNWELIRHSGAYYTYANGILKDTETSNLPDINLAPTFYVSNSYSSTAEYYYIDFIFIREYSTDTITQAFGSEETQAPSTVLNVTLNAPADNSIWNESTNVQFNFTPVVENAVFENCSLWTNESGSWALTQANTSAIQNDTINSISYDFGANTTIIWNVQCFANDSTEAWADANFTLTINYTAPATPTGNCPSANAPTDLSIYQTKATGSCCLNNNTVRYYWTIGNTNYTRDENAPNGCVYNEKFEAIEQRPPFILWAVIFLILILIVLFVLFK